MTEEKDPKIAEIVKRKQEGKNWTEISQELEVSRKTIYNLRTTDAYMEIVDRLFVDLMENIERFSESDSYSFQIEALKEKGKMLRALLPSLSVIQHRRDKDEIQTNIETTADRKRKERLLKELELTPAQWKKLEESVIDGE